MATSHSEQVQRFIRELESNGELYFSTGDTEQDYNHITGLLKQQGYWSGARDRFYFSDELHLVNITSRWTQ